MSHKITIVGGGSFGWTPRLVRDMVLTEGLSDSEYVLYDIDPSASDLTKAFLDKLQESLGTRAKIVSTDKPERAFKEAEYVIITISTGGLNAMARDLAIPEDYSVYHTVGDTSGPGGWARTIRNFGPFMDLAEMMNRWCPGAVVLNYTNPMSTLTDLLCRAYDGPVVGLCHGLFENMDFIRDQYKLDGYDDIHVRYAGVNHFFWMTEAKAGDRDVIADLARKLKRRSITDLIKDRIEDPLGFHSNHEIATEMFRLTGVLPYLGDRHTSEFFPWYITRKENMKKYRLVRTFITGRRKYKSRAKSRLVRQTRGKLADGWEQRSRETAADIVSSHANGRVFIDVGNVPNTGQVTNLPLGAVVETAVRVDRNGFDPVAFGELPEIVAGFVEPYCRVFGMTVDACFAGDRRMAVQALRLDPVCSHLNGEQVEEMADRLLKAHKKFITAF